MIPWLKEKYGCEVVAFAADVGQQEDMEKVKEKAAEYGHSQEDELALLFIHGMLHLAGYDHESDDGEMRARERELIEEFGLPESLIVRNGG